MSVSEKAVNVIFAQLQSRDRGATYEELTKLTGYSIATVKNVISVLNHRGNIAQSHTRPTVLRAVTTPPQPGQTLIIREPVPPLELNPKMIVNIQSAIAGPAKTENDELLTVLFDRARRSSPEKLHNLMTFLVNFTEVLRIQMDTHELTADDLNGN